MDKPTTAVLGPIELAVECGKSYWWCACGLSKRQPLCDGSHRGTQFSPLEYRATETGTKTFCVCKRTRSPPLCDGTPHACSAGACAIRRSHDT